MEEATGEINEQEIGVSGRGRGEEQNWLKKCKQKDTKEQNNNN